MTLECPRRVVPRRATAPGGRTSPYRSTSAAGESPASDRTRHIASTAQRMAFITLSPNRSGGAPLERRRVAPGRGATAIPQQLAGVLHLGRGGTRGRAWSHLAT